MTIERRFTAILLVAIGAIFTLQAKSVLGWSPDVLLPILVVLAFFVDIYYLLFLAGLLAWLINWQSVLALEIWLLIATPLLAWLGRKFMPSSSWLTLVVVTIVAELSLYLMAGQQVFKDNLSFIAFNTVFAVLIGLGLWNLLQYFYEQE